MVGQGTSIAHHSSGSCDVIYPLTKQIGNFEAAGEIVVLVHEFLILALEYSTCEVGLGSGAVPVREGCAPAEVTGA